jgi:hypothetical protein
VSGSLSIAALLIIASAFAWVFGFENVSVRDRAFAVSDSLGVVPAILALGATLTFRMAQHPRWSLLLARCSAVMVCLAAVYGLWYSAGLQRPPTKRMDIEKLLPDHLYEPRLPSRGCTSVLGGWRLGCRALVASRRSEVETMPTESLDAP